MKKFTLLFLTLFYLISAFAQEDVTNPFLDLERKGNLNESKTNMTVKAEEQDIQSLFKSFPDKKYFSFTENRINDIRSTEYLPKTWFENSLTNLSYFKGESQPGEFYTFQVAVYPRSEKLKNIKVKFSSLKNESENSIPASAFECFNLEGTDIYGNQFTKSISVPASSLQTLWIGIEVPASAKGLYSGYLTITPENAPEEKIKVDLNISGKVLTDKGDSEGWRHSRLRWLNSKIGKSNSPTPPYEPVTIQNQAIKFTSGKVELNNIGLPSRIITNYNSLNLLDKEIENEILNGEIQFIVETANGIERLKGQRPKISHISDEKVVWKSKANSSNIELECEGELQFDGFAEIKIAVKARKDIAIKDIRMEISYTEFASKYFMGLGKKGGFRDENEFTHKWDTTKRQDEYWMGNINGGLKIKFKDENYRRPLVNIYYGLGRIHLPKSWGNEGKGGIRITPVKENGTQVVAFSGERNMKKGEALNFNMELLITPVKPVDMAKQVQDRYYHSNSDVSASYIPQAKARGANMINIHHKKDIYPFINYPYYDESIKDFKAFVDSAEKENIGVRVYYTTRELTVKIPEIWAFRSLGNEVIMDGPGKDTRTRIHRNGPNQWLVDNFSTHFIPAWYNAFRDGKYKGDMDISIITTPDSRWNNYYLEGLDWMVKNIGIKGIYIDDSALDRETLKRARRVLDADNVHRTVDLHSWNHMNQDAGFSNSLLNYADLLPYVDRLWIGEGFHLTNSPDFWLVEMSGIPFGLMSETLDSKNYWRGMVFGMTPRLPWSGDPTELWKLYDNLGMENAVLYGFWNEDSPIKSDNENVKVSTFLMEDKVLVVIANWTDFIEDCTLTIDEEALGFSPQKSTLPEMRNIQWGGNRNIKAKMSIKGQDGLFILLEK